MNEIASLIINTGFSKLADQNMSLPETPQLLRSLPGAGATDVSKAMLVDMALSSGKSSLYGAGLGALYMGARGGGGAVNRLARATLGGILGGGAAGLGGAVGYNPPDPSDVDVLLENLNQ